MSEEEDLELKALQRQLDDAFQTTRPRPAFEDELWLRMQSRRPIWSRIRDGVTGLIAGLREAPAVPAAAVAHRPDSRRWGGHHRAQRPASRRRCHKRDAGCQSGWQWLRARRGWP